MTLSAKDLISLKLMMNIKYLEMKKNTVAF